MCLKLSNKKDIIGRCKLTNLNPECEVVDGIETLLFTSFANAMFYCIYVQTNNEEDAKSLALLDAQVRYLTSDSNLFKIKMATAIKNKDSWKHDLFEARYEQANSQLMYINEEMSKKLILAKYYKLKDFHL